MSRFNYTRYSPGSAEMVVAHGTWRRSQGRNPSMTFVGERNPRKALVLAQSVLDRVRFDDLIYSVVPTVVKDRKYDELGDVELKAAASQIIRTSNSEEEVKRRLLEELGYPYNICLHTTIPNDATGREARELVRGLGGLVMKNGAMAMAMMHGHHGVISL